MKRVKYKEYIINAGAWKVRNGKGWLPKASIEYHFGSGVTITPLESSEIIFDENEAIKYSVAMARRWIDKKY